MKYRDLRDFMAQLEQAGGAAPRPIRCRRKLEMTAFGDQVAARRRAGGAVHSSPQGYKIPGADQPVRHPARVALGMGADVGGELRDVGRCWPA
jgi:4-hydroxy-3-polyprenylbenzoate decarboxylase